jgi:ribosome maturation factor RimP
MKIKSIEEIENALLPIATEQNLEIVEVEFKQGREPSLTVYIDTENGVDLNTCEAFHRAIDPVLDELDPTFGLPYTLNVSSPGLDRPLKTERDFNKCMGKKVEVKLFAPMQGKKFFEATLKGHDENCVYLEDKGTELKLEKAKIAKICRAIDFAALGLA